MKTTESLAVAFMTGTALFLFSGCATVNSVEPAQPTAQRQMIPDKRVLTDSDLSRHVSILGVNTATGPGGFLQIQVEVQNRTRSVQSFTYRIEWFDENGMMIHQPTTAAVPRTIEGKETIDITAIAPTERAKDFRIKFLEPTN